MSQQKLNETSILVPDEVMRLAVESNRFFERISG